jgi:alpha-D-ribose 1-methylphosphonate 5-triphosphate synthase subunit PhnG
MENATTTAARQDWLGLLARAPGGDLARLWDGAGLTAPFDWLRRPEIGTVMLRGRAGATGAAFNLGEMTVTRASVRLTTGEVGHGHVQGRDKRAAECAALVDALMQTDRAPVVRALILDPLARTRADLAQARAEKAAATRVEFFTMVRGEDQ